MIAQAYFMEGDLKQAQLFAKRAQTKLPLRHARMAEERRHHQLQTADLIAAAIQARQPRQLLSRGPSCP